MESKNKTDDIKKYREDIKTIKSILHKVDEKPIFEPWFLVANSILGFTAALFQYVTVKFFQFSVEDIIFKIWTPFFIICCTLEPYAVLRKMLKESLPIFSRPIVKLYVGLSGLGISTGTIIFFILKAGAIEILPVTVFCLFGIFYFIYGQVAYNSMLLQGFIMISTGLFLGFSELTLDTQLMTVPVGYGFSTLIIAITEIGKEKNEK